MDGHARGRAWRLKHPDRSRISVYVRSRRYQGTRSWVRVANTGDGGARCSDSNVRAFAYAHAHAVTDDHAYELTSHHAQSFAITNANGGFADHPGNGFAHNVPGGCSTYKRADA